MITEDFLQTVHRFPEKTAFIDYEKNRIRKHSFFDVFEDMKKVIRYFESLKIEKGTPILLFLKPNYDFYILLLAGIYCQYQMIVIESFKDPKKLQALLKLSAPKYIITDRKTWFLKFLFRPLAKFKAIPIYRYRGFEPAAIMDPVPSHIPVLITFTSGSTGIPKKIGRSVFDLEKQFALVRSVIANIAADDVMLSFLPIYVLANVVMGITTVLFPNNPEKKTSRIKLYRLLRIAKVNAIAGSVSRYLQFFDPVLEIKKAYTGGSPISYRDALTIRNTFPNADFTYVYGASEAVLISKTNLDDYISNLEQNRICIGPIASGVTVTIENPDSNGIGEIAVVGNAVLGLKNRPHKTGDLGYLENNRVFLKGRKKMSYCSETNNIYNYDLEMNVLRHFPTVNKAAFVFDSAGYLIVEGKDVKKEEIESFVGNGITVILVKKMPTDFRHHYKADYLKLLSLIKNKVKK